MIISSYIRFSYKNVFYSDPIKGEQSVNKWIILINDACILLRVTPATTNGKSPTQ